MNERRGVVAKQRQVGHALPAHDGRRQVSSKRMLVGECPRSCVHIDHRHRGLLSLSGARKHPWTWSLTTPTFCMNAYTLDGPTKRYPCDFSCFANASACGVDVGRSAMDGGSCAVALSEDY